MSIQDKIIKAEALIQWIDQRIDGLEISSDERTRISAACLDMALEHQKAIVLLVANKLVGSAFSLVRLIFEAYIRGLWLSRCASGQEIEKYKKNKLEKTFATLIQEIEQIEGFHEGVLSKTKVASWNSMNSYTHSGYLQSVRRNKTDTIEPNYDTEEVIEVLGFANAIGMLSALQVALLAGNEKLAMELLEKSKTELGKP
jgi:hypothetical protein